MTIKELITEVAGKDSGWCLCSTPDLKFVKHVEEELVEAIVTRVIDRCEKAMVDALHENDIVDMEDAEGANGKWIKDEWKKRVLPLAAEKREE